MANLPGRGAGWPTFTDNGQLIRFCCSQPQGDQPERYLEVIRRAVTGDFLDIARLDRCAWGDNRHAEFIPDGEHVWRMWVEHALVYCSFDKSAINGSIVAFPTLKDAFCLHKVFVAPLSRGHGTGTRLFNEVLGEIDRLKVDCFLTVDPENERALALYGKCGFVETRYVPGFYREAEDRLVLTRRV